MPKKKTKDQLSVLKESGPRNEVAPGSNTWTSWLGVIALGCLATAVAVVFHSSLLSSYNSSKNVVSRNVFNGSLSYRELAELRQPMILTNTLVEQWPACKAFTTKFLSQKIKHVMAHIQNTRTFITFHDSKPYEDLVSERWEDFNVKVNTTIPRVLQWDEKNGADPTKGPYLYYTQDLATMSSQFPDVIGYVQPLQELILSKENIQVNLWVGREGLITHTHYDCSYNFFFQLQGRKRFTLFPPDQDMYLYPCLHPHYGHSQVDIVDPDYTTFPLFKKSVPVVAEVEPGDMLVVPPFWFHHVETLEESVSVNIWSDAPEYELMNQLYALPIPFEEDWSQEKMMVATKTYIDMLLPILNLEPKVMINSLLSQRYNILIKGHLLNLSTTITEEIEFLCSDNYQWNIEKERLEPVLENGVKNSAIILRRITIRSILEICVDNFIEHLVHSTVGADMMYPFLRNCWI